MSPASSAGGLRLRGNDGAIVELVPYGAALKRFCVPTRDVPVDIVLGLTNVDDYRDNPYYLGSTVGRYANRIANGRFVLNGETVRLATQANGHCLHGGPDGLANREWNVRDSSSEHVTFDCQSATGEQGFPGNLHTTARYELTTTGSVSRLTISLSASSDVDTVVSLTNHAYFNLAGGGRIDDHRLTVNADSYTPTDEQDIPTGAVLPVDGTEFDFRVERSLADAFVASPTGIDKNLMLRKTGATALNVDGTEPPLAASLRSVGNGVTLRVYTSQPGLQLYTGQFLEQPFFPFAGVCLEAQGFPDSPNHPNFPSTLLAATDEYRQTIVYEVTVD